MWLVALALIVRAFIPTGYMPDAHAAREGRVSVTFCTAGGGQQIIDVLLATPEDTHGGKSESFALADCAFATLAHGADPRPTILPILPAMALPGYVDFHVPVYTIVTRAAGPPVGSRAPPRA